MKPVQGCHTEKTLNDLKEGATSGFAGLPVHFKPANGHQALILSR
jgi:hypothetical protein